jgi:MFS family permease
MAMRDKKTLWLGWAICLLGALFYTYEYLLRIEPSLMVKELEHYYGLSAAGLGVLSAYYYWAYTPMQLLVGAVIDYYGPRLVLTVAVGCCAFGSYLFGVAEVIWVAALGRFFIGFGSAFAFVGVLKLAATWLPQRHFALFAGLTTGLGMAGAMAGNMGMTSMINMVGWQDTIYYGTVLGLILVPLIWLVVRDHHSWTPRGEDHKDFERFGDMFRGFREIASNRQMWMGGIIGMVLFFSLSVFSEMWGIQFLEHLYPGATEEQIVRVNMMVFAGWLIGAPFSGWLSDWMQSRRLPLIFGSVLTVVIISVVLYYPQISLNQMRVLLFFFGFFSAVQINCFVVGRENCPEHMSATAIAFINMCVMASGLFFQPFVGVLVDYSQRTREGVAMVGGHLNQLVDYQVGLSVIPIGLLICVVLSLFLEESYGRGGIEE